MQIGRQYMMRSARRRVGKLGCLERTVTGCGMRSKVSPRLRIQCRSYGTVALMERDKPIGMTRLLRAFGYSFQGCMHAWREEAALRKDVCLSALLTPLGFFLWRSGVDR